MVPKKEAENGIFLCTKANPNTHQKPTTRCDSCMLLLQERQRQEEEMRKSNMAQVVVLSARQGQHQDEASLQSAKKYRYSCPRCGKNIPSDVRDGCIGNDHKKCDNQTLCGFQFDVQNGIVKTQSTAQGYSYICFEHSSCKSNTKKKYAVVQEELHKKNGDKKRVQYRCKACGKPFNINKDTDFWTTRSPDGCERSTNQS